MKIYEKVAIITQESSTSDAKKNKLVKLRYDIMDFELLALVDEYIFALTYYLKNGYTRQTTLEQRQRGIPENWKQSSDLISRCSQALRTYAEARLAERRPQWQVEALKHGWTPPRI